LAEAWVVKLNNMDKKRRRDAEILSEMICGMYAPCKQLQTNESRITMQRGLNPAGIRMNVEG